LRFNSVFHMLGNLLVFLGLTMILPLLCSLYYREPEAIAFLWSIALTVGAGFWMRRFRFDYQISHKEGFSVVTLGWLLAAFFGAIPFLLSGTFTSFWDAYFETMSGFTTTGATVLTNIEQQPRGILFWRSMTQWLGGMGIILLFVAILPRLGTGGMQLMKAEVPGPVAEKVLPRVAQTAKVLWLVYVGISSVQFVLLYLTGLSPFEAATHTFTTMATGGYSTRDLSIAAFNNLLAEVIIIIFMFIAGGNFALYYGLLKGNHRKLLMDGEYRFYVFTTVAAILLVTGNLWLHVYDGLWESLRYASFQVISLLTTTGYTTANYDAWPPFSRCILLLLMFLGGCGGSTAGAIKQVRFLILLKHSYRELYKMIHPRAVMPVRVGPKNIPEPVVASTLAFVFIYIIIAIISTLVLNILGLDIISAFSAVAATLGNVGPALGMLGPLHTYAGIPTLGKVILTLNMLCGRLEIYSVFVFLILAEQCLVKKGRRSSSG